MSTSNIIGTVQVASGDIKIVALDGTSRAAVYGDYIFEGEQILSDDSASLFQIRYLEGSEPKAYSGVFSIMADGSSVAEAQEDDIDVFETAAGEEGVESNSQNIEDNPEAIDYVQTFGRSANDAVYSEERNLGEERQFGGLEADDENPPVIKPEGQTRLEFISESAGYNNVLGIYTLDDIGNPINPQIVMTGTNAGGNPADSILDLEFGSFGLFIIPNGDYEGIADATLSFNPENPTELLIDGDPTTVYYDNNDWNQGGKDHFDVVANSDGSINITIEDLNLGDNDRNDLHIKLTPIGDSVGGVVVELPDGSEGENVDLLTTSGTLDFDDLDLEDTHTTTVSFTPDEDGYLGTFDASISTSATGAGEGEITWGFEVNDALLDSMGAYDSIVQTYTVTVTDNTGLSDTQEVKILIQGTNDAPEVSSEVITKVADHVIGEDIVEPADVDAVTFSWVCPFISDDAEVVVRNNGSYAVDDQNKVGWWIFAIPDGDKENFVDSKGLWNEGLIFSFENDVTNSTVGLSNIDSNDRVLVKLYDAGGNVVHNMGVLDLHSGHSNLNIDEGVSFRSIGIYALDTWGGCNPETDFRVSSVTAVEPFEYNTVLDFVIDDAMLLDNDSDVEGDELEVQLTGDTNVYLGTDAVGSVSINGDGDVQVTMNSEPETYDDGATLTFSYAVSDGIDTSNPAIATINVQHGDIDGVEVSYDQTSGEFIIGTDLGNEAMPENVLTVGETIDLSDVSNINTIQLEGDATVTGSSELGHVNPSDVLGATDGDNTLIVQSVDGDNALDQIDVHESFGNATAFELDGIDYAKYTDGTATLLVEIDEPIEVV